MLDRSNLKRDAHVTRLFLSTLSYMCHLLDNLLLCWPAMKETTLMVTARRDHDLLSVLIFNVTFNVYAETIGRGLDCLSVRTFSESRDQQTNDGRKVFIRLSFCVMDVCLSHLVI